MAKKTDKKNTHPSGKADGKDETKADKKLLVKALHKTIDKALDKTPEKAINPSTDSKELEKAMAYITVEIIEYIPNSVVIKTVLKKSTGNVSVMSFDDGEGLTERISPFDSYAQIIEGKAEFMIDGKSISLKTGQSIIIPAHKSNLIKPNGRFKMILTVIKSGYEL